MARKILLTGATGFVGRHVREALEATSAEVRCGSRDPERAARRVPDATWCRVDVNDEDSLRAALKGCDAAIYLVHSMGSTDDYATEERRAAERFADACVEAGVERVVYLGGVAPAGEPSVHLASRIETGRMLRERCPGVVELRAAMVIGAGSESWRICRDLAVRLPLMVLPKWLQTRSYPVAIEDVVAAIVHAALADAPDLAGCYDLPGPECLSAEEILRRIARLRGIDPVTIPVPLLSPSLSSYWLKLVSGANYDVARELVQGLTEDLLPTCPLYWDRMPDHELIPFDEAAARALEHEEPLPISTRWLETTIRRLARRYREA